jgi:hypothetical protein
MAEWLRRQPAKLMGFARVGSNPTVVEFLFYPIRNTKLYHTADASIISPFAYIPDTPYNILRIAKAISHENGKPSRYVCDWVSDHLPVSMDDETFVKNVSAKIEKECTESETDPFVACGHFTQAIFDEAKAQKKRNKEAAKNNHNDMTDIHLCIKAMKLINAGAPNIDNIRNFFDKHRTLTPLAPLLDNFPLDDKLMRAHINSLLVKQGSDNFEQENFLEKHIDELLINPLPSTTAPKGSNRAAGFIEDVRRSGNLRSGSRLHSLRVDSHSPPTSDPEKMANILSNCWQLWGNRRTNSPSDEQIEEYLCSYDVALPANFVLNIPSIDDIIDYIHKTKNSCPGPDGVHYALLRPFSHKIAWIIRGILVSMSEGKKPPSDFNEVLQFYFPKSDSLLPQDTRPISVANTVCRIIAKILADSITPAAKKILNKAQKGFIPGRSINEHVEDVTNVFYSNLRKKQQHYILFLDTEKAFDSLDHGFIFKVLNHIGCPEWYINCYKGLLHNIQGITRIFLNRGVKQGCPMSPIVFALCFDVLLHKLSLLGDDCEDFAFADDLAISTSKFACLVSCLHVIKSFSLFSGLGLNYKKSVMFFFFLNF